MSAASLKSANVSYSLNEIRKSLYVPLIEEEFVFGSGMTDAVWQKAVRADDFAIYSIPEGQAQPEKTEMAVFRTAEHFVIGWKFFGNPANRLYPAEDVIPASPWLGDMAELHFGSTGPDPWLLQLGLGITGLEFDSSGQKLWQSYVFENADAWGAEVRIELSQLPLTEGGFYFNLCRCDMKNRVSCCWSPLKKRFHEVENFGELLFETYDNTALLRSGTKPAVSLDRQSFEKLRNTWEIPAQKVIHGPYLSNPEQGSVCINWVTAGRVPAFLEYKEKDSADEPRRIFCSQAHGILASESSHFVRLENLKSDTVYQYQLFSLTPVIDTPQGTGEIRYFRTAPDADSSFSFFGVTDLHSDADHLVRALNTQWAQKAAFHLLLGDNLSHAAGREALYGGVIDPIVSVNRQKESDIPLVFVRGNHEQLGIFANEYFTVMRHHSGRTYYAFCCGNVFVIILDSGNDKADDPEKLLFSNNQLLAEQKEFLAQIVDTPAYKQAAYRVAFIHIPPLIEKDTQLELAQILSQAETPLSLMLSGHWHSYIRVDKDSGEFHPATSLQAVERLKKPVPLPFLRVALSTENAFCCQVGDDGLQLDILRIEADGSAVVIDSAHISRK